jgi:hypothetical protein
MQKSFITFEPDVSKIMRGREKREKERFNDRNL